MKKPFVFISYSTKELKKQDLFMRTMLLKGTYPQVVDICRKTDRICL